MLLVPTDDRLKAAIDVAANALQAALLLATRLEAEHADLRSAIERAARALAALKPREDR